MSETTFFYVVAAAVIVLFATKQRVHRAATAAITDRTNAEWDPRFELFYGVRLIPYWMLIDYIRYAIAGLVAYLAIAFRLWKPGVVVALLVYAGSSWLMRRLLWNSLPSVAYHTFVKPDSSQWWLKAGTRLIRLYTRTGDALLGIVIYLPIWTVLYRADAGLIVYFLVFLLPIFTVRAMHQMSTLALKAPRPAWLSLGATLVSIPFILAWIAGSTAWWLSGIRHQPLAAGEFAPPPVARCADGERRWKAADEPIRVAVALSGGGYRAAVAHAGLLAALDQECVPIDYLTTVSGGSIVGATYALGVPPHQFFDRLRRARPGLPNDLLSVSGVVREWVWPFSTNAEVYSDHFRRNFFGDATLASLRDRPQLIVNATDLQSPDYETREVFFKGRAPDARIGEVGLDHATRLSDVVAASAAFPGAFEPKRVAWVPRDGDGPVRERPFIDGGVIENLGLEGLRRFFRIGGSQSAHPHLLIVSDASQYGAGAAFKRKAELVRLLARSESLSYQALHRQLYARYTGRSDFWTWSRTEPISAQLSAVPYVNIDSGFTQASPSRLLTVAVPITTSSPPHLASTLPACDYEQGVPLNEVQRQVSAFDTLTELESEEAARAYWLGYNLGRMYASAIECARQQIATGLSTCALPSTMVPKCYGLSDILAAP